MIINIRGTSGSGKSTLARRIMADYTTKEAVFVEGRKKPFYYICRLSGIKDLAVLGHYESECGGVDTIHNGYDVIFAKVRELHAQGYNIMLEGLLLSGDKNRTIELNQQTEGAVWALVLDTPLDECLRRVVERRKRRGNEKPLNPTVTVNKHKVVQKNTTALRVAGVRVVVDDADALYAVARGEFS